MTQRMLSETEINAAIMTDAGRREVARQLAPRSVLTSAQLYEVLCNCPLADAELPAPACDRPTLVDHEKDPTRHVCSAREMAAYARALARCES